MTRVSFLATGPGQLSRISGFGEACTRSKAASGRTATTAFALAPAGPLIRNHGERMTAAAAQHINRHRASDLFACEQADQIVGAGNGNAVERENNIASAQIAACGGASGLDCCNHDCAGLRYLGRIPKPSRDTNLLRCDPDVGAPDAAVANQLTK